MRKNKKHPFKFGDVIGRLTLIESIQCFDVKSGRNRRFWKCKCSCGGSIITRHDTLYRNTVSCGCFHREEVVKRLTKPRGVVCFSIIKWNYICGARDRGYVWELNDELFTKLIQGNCFYCGVDPQFTTNMRIKKGATKTIAYNGVDRVENTVGYVPGNCVSCCPRCNRMKLAMGLEEFKSHIKLLHSRIAAGCF